MVLIVMLFHEIRAPSRNQHINLHIILMIILARFICGSILHLSLIDEVTNSLSYMKYALNHPYKFQSYNVAFQVGLMQFTSTLLTEITNLIVLCACNDAVNIIFNFTAIAIVAEFDNFVFESMKNESFKELLEEKFTSKVLIINHTTSKKCKEHELSTEKDEYGELRPLKVNFKDRETLNKVYFVVYKILKGFYVSFYFYFIPFTVILISAIVPILYRYNIQ